MSINYDCDEKSASYLWASHLFNDVSEGSVFINYGCDSKSDSYWRAYGLLNYLILWSAGNEVRLLCPSTMIVIENLPLTEWLYGILNYLMLWSAVGNQVGFSTFWWCFCCKWVKAPASIDYGCNDTLLSTGGMKTFRSHSYTSTNSAETIAEQHSEGILTYPKHRLKQYSDGAFYSLSKFDTLFLSI